MPENSHDDDPVARHDEGLRFAYEVIASRQQTQANLLWQTPSLALTAQAFLLTIALAPDFSPTAHYLGAALGLVVAVISMQLMAKHRFLEDLDSYEMGQLERQLGLPRIASRGWAYADAPGGPGGDHARRRVYILDSPRTSWLRRQRSYWVWQVGIGLFGVANLGIIAIQLVRPGLLR